MSLLARIELELATFARTHGAEYVTWGVSFNDRGATYVVEMHRGGSIHEGTGPTLAEALTNAANARIFNVDRLNSPVPACVQTGGA